VTSASGRVIAALPDTIGTAQVFGIAPADDDRELVLVSATGVRTVSLPSGISTQRLVAFRALKGPPAYGLALSPDGDAAVAESGSGRLVYLDLASGASRVVEGPVPNGQGAVAALTRSLIVADRYSDSAGRLQEWSTAGTSLVRTVPDVGSGGPIAVSPDGTMMAWVSGQGVASVVDLATGTRLATFTLPSSQSSAPEPGDLTAVRFTPDGHYLLTATPGGALGRWDFRESDLIRVACTRAARNLTRAQWQQYVGTTAPANLSCLR
jgi:DNA-binding beta-propeller fold protein YncE